MDETTLTSRTVPESLARATSPYIPVYADLLARPERPARRRNRAALWVPVAGVVGLAGAYTAATLLWPLTSVAPVVTTADVADVAAPAAVVEWPEYGSGAVGVVGFDSVLSSTDEENAAGDDVAPERMASITKLVTALLVLEKQPLALGEQGPSYEFTREDLYDYWASTGRGESALTVPVGESLTLYQMLQAVLIVSAGNYADRLVAELWDSEEAFVAEATAYLAAAGIDDITIVEPTGIHTENVASPASVIALAELALAHPVIAEIVDQESVELPEIGEIENTNELLGEDPDVIGLKTGTLRQKYNLVAAKTVTVEGMATTVIATSLDQFSNRSRHLQTARLLDETAASLTTGAVEAGTVVGSVTTLWGDHADIATTDDARVLLWNEARGVSSADIDLANHRAAGDTVGTLTLTGPAGDSTVDVALSGDIAPPDAWWRLTHPLELFGLSD